jgi:nucleotide-binding universal stress UspA family protein
VPDAQPTPYRPRRLDGPVLVGVTPGQSLAVLHRAADLAHTLAVPLVCAFADPAAFSEREADGRREAVAIDPDGVDDGAGIRADLHRGLTSELADTGLTWTFVALAGEPAAALGGHAEEIDASMIVVGSRERTRLEEVVGGSVALRLSHRQARPVVVVPLGHHVGHHRGRGER